MKFTDDPYKRAFATIYTCPCGWCGLGEKCTTDFETELITSLRCPECDIKLVHITNRMYLLLDDESRAYFEKIENERRSAFQKLPDNLENLELIFTSLSKDDVTLFANGSDIYQFEASFESWSQILEIVTIAREIYLEKKISVTLQSVNSFIWGDDITGPKKLEKGISSLGASLQHLS